MSQLDKSRATLGEDTYLADARLMDPANHKGKIAFIYPAKRQHDGFPSPALNFVALDGRVGLVIGTAFADLNQGSAYMIRMNLSSPTGEEVITTHNMDGIPPAHIHPEYGTTFLSADMFFEVKEYGTYSFACELWEMMTTKVDEKVIYFNIHMVDDDASK
ncbi:TPA: hypothetical protein MYO85_002042 [Citrobacter braakii]|uniref:hypothetical protein n=1 Tax=Citrobacter sp. RHBSTW-00017 TaxID=2742629 RepID=UPI0015E97145|nr:hypothetical protein [Citrobacter sp. RHBSTW-00017]QMA31735.1 hypothetical protein HV037_07930 [Citrobacter sp. RHBSTW-00017]HCB1493692.1 hypothetical protein [Citrobacter braakii]HCB1746752.1 hypothetical protein [Citrobacter braakii]HCB1802151.1 hypothetical protein [Citrobacter braakii]